MARAPWLLGVRSSQRVILLTICAAAFTDGFMYAIFVPILPITLQERYGVNKGNVQIWTSALLGIFGAVVLLGSPIIGWISDKEDNRKPAYTFGLICLSGGVVTLAITRSLWMLLASRILQGISAAVVFTIGLALIADTVHPKEIGYKMGYALSAMNCGVLAGPVIGSLLFEASGYYAVVALMLGVAIVDIFLRLFMIEKRTAEKYLDALPEDSERGRLLPTSPLPTITKPLNYSQQRVSKFRTFTLLAQPRIATAIYGVFLQIVIVTSFDGVLPIFLRSVFEWETTKIGLCFVAIGVPNTLFGPVAGRMADIWGPRWIAFGGCLGAAIPMTLLQLVKENETGQMWLLYILLAVLGATLSLIISPLAADLFFVIENLEANGEVAAYAQAYSLFTCAMAAGTLGGPVLAGWLKECFGWEVMCWAMGAFVASGSVPVWLYTGRSPN
ncbi:major facilitator superfamily domain-containing protein [Tricladium varicosporioides]|nr:major facilitator superfamily domain-containing protein [Hymenoscyphus varicosporioides]